MTRERILVCKYVVRIGMDSGCSRWVGALPNLNSLLILCYFLVTTNIYFKTRQTSLSGSGRSNLLHCTTAIHWYYSITC